mgnify:CR=1 FL=1
MHFQIDGCPARSPSTCAISHHRKAWKTELPVVEPASPRTECCSAARDRDFAQVRRQCYARSHGCCISSHTLFPGSALAHSYMYVCLGHRNLICSFVSVDRTGFSGPESGKCFFSFDICLESGILAGEERAWGPAKGVFLIKALGAASKASYEHKRS